MPATKGRVWTATRLTCTPKLPHSPTHRLWTPRSSLGTAPPVQKLRSLHLTLRTGGAARARTRLPNLRGPLPTSGEAARAPAWCEGGWGLVVVCPGAKGAWNMRPCCSEWRSEGTRQGNNSWWAQITRGCLFFSLTTFTVLMFRSWWRSPCLLAA